MDYTSLIPSDKFEFPEPIFVGEVCGIKFYEDPSLGSNTVIFKQRSGRKVTTVGRICNLGDE